MIDPAKLLEVLSLAGLRIVPHFNGMIEVIPAKLITDIHRALIRGSKDELLRYLKESARKEGIEERAAIMEFDGGMLREDAERKAEIIYQKMPIDLANATKMIFREIPGAKITYFGPSRE